MPPEGPSTAKRGSRNSGSLFVLRCDTDTAATPRARNADSKPSIRVVFPVPDAGADMINPGGIIAHPESVARCPLAGTDDPKCLGTPRLLADDKTFVLLCTVWLYCPVAIGQCNTNLLSGGPIPALRGLVKASVAWDQYLLGHADWFIAPHGQAFLNSIEHGSLG